MREPEPGRRCVTEQVALFVSAFAFVCEMGLLVGEDGLGGERGCGPAPCLPRLIPHLPSSAAYCRGRRTYCITSLQHQHQHQHATRPRIAAVPFVQHMSCKLREGAVLPAYCSEVRYGRESVLNRGGHGVR